MASLGALRFPTVIEYRAECLTRPLEFRAITRSDVAPWNWNRPVSLIGGAALCDVDEHVRRPRLWLNYGEFISYRDSVLAGQFDETIGPDVPAERLIRAADSKITEEDRGTDLAIFQTTVFSLRGLVTAIKNAGVDYYPDPGISDIRDIPTLPLIGVPAGSRVNVFCDHEL